MAYTASIKRLPTPFIGHRGQARETQSAQTNALGCYGRAMLLVAGGPFTDARSLPPDGEGPSVSARLVWRPRPCFSLGVGVSAPLPQAVLSLRLPFDSSIEIAHPPKNSAMTIRSNFSW